MLTLLLDSHAIAYRSYYTTGGLSHEDRATGIAFGYFTTMLELSERFHTNQFVFLWDGVGSKRREVFKEYKASRWNEKTAEELAERKRIHDQIDALRDDILPMAGFKNLFKQDGYEADDLIAWLVENEKNKIQKQQFVAVSGDNDLFQLLRFPNYRQWTPSNKPRVPGVLWNATTFAMEYGIPAREWVAVKCLAGCEGDGVPGVAGVKVKRAIAYLKDEMKTGGAKWKAITGYPSELLKRNRMLVSLPFPGVAPMKIEQQKLDPKNLFTLFKDLGFESFLTEKNRQRWDAMAIRNWKMEELF